MPHRPHLTPIERIEKNRTVTPEGCWETSFTPSLIYPTLKVEGKSRPIHRLAYEALVNPIPEGLYVLHKCDNPRCHNPDHLFLGTLLDNARDRDAKKRNKNSKQRQFDHELIVRLAQQNREWTLDQIAQSIGCSNALVSVVLRGLGLSTGRGNWAHVNPPKGEANPRARLTEVQVKQIRSSSDTFATLAEQYGVSRSTISAIQSRRNWAHVPD